MASEKTHQSIIDDFLSERDGPDVFIERFMTQWKTDRDAGRVYDARFQRLINRLFTSCDCYSDEPTTSFDITEEELRHEVGLLRHIWFG